MSTFRRDMSIVLDGTPYKVTTSAQDNMNAEIMLSKSKDAGTIETRQVAMGYRVAFAAFRRTYPDNELAQSFTRFVDVLDDMDALDAMVDDDDGEAIEPGPLDPIPPAGSDASPSP